MYTKMLLLSALLIVKGTFGKEIFPAKIPNGQSVTVNNAPWKPVGHLSANKDFANAGTLNPFGLDVQSVLNDARTDFNWAAICDLDSDGDGWSNGKELGDEDCKWTPGNDAILTAVIGHPGFKDSTGGVIVIEKPTATRGFKAHATLMVLAWTVFAPLGVISAVLWKTRVKTSPLKKTLCGVLGIDWFKLHKLCVGTAVYFTLLAYAIAVNELGLFKITTTHTKLGTSVVILAVIQPFLGFIRPHVHPNGKGGFQPKSSIRLVWEYLHQWVGRGLLTLAVVAIYFGFKTAGFVTEEQRKGMQSVVIILLVLGGIFCVFWVWYRVDEREYADVHAVKVPDPEVGDGNKKTASESGEVKDVPTAAVKGQSPDANPQPQQSDPPKTVRLN